MNNDLNQLVEARLDRGLDGLWYVLAKSVDVRAGQVFPVQALGRKLVLWRGADGVVRCTEDYCPHRGAPLSRGRVSGDHIACGYHGIEIDGNGVIALVPALEGCALQGRKAITGYPVREAAGGVFVYFPSADQPEPPELALPVELTDDSQYAHFLATGVWECNYRYALDNLADPMHGCYLHAESFTLSAGVKQDLMKLERNDHGFEVRREAQQGVNFDWAQLHVDGLVYARVVIPYPRSGGPGGILRIAAFVTPIDDTRCRIFFWRIREVSGIERESWRFMFRAVFEPRHWHVLEQDREMLCALPQEARRREMLYQHDIGVTHVRRLLSQKARRQIEAEVAAAGHG